MKNRILIERLLLGLFSIPILIGCDSNTNKPTFGITYCLQYDESREGRQCINKKKLKIPSAYSFGPSPNGSIIYLAGVYPSLKPWDLATKEERGEEDSNQIEIDIRGLDRRHAKDIAFLIHLDILGLSHQPNPLYGLDYYKGQQQLRGKGIHWKFWEEPGPDLWFWNEMFIAEYQKNDLYMDCTLGSEERDSLLTGCTTWTFTPWSLGVNYHFRRKYAPQWQEMNQKVLALIESFVVQE
ncbi:hypothetical protein ACMYR3_13900 [Ampullimonas aquatilis]|uniref:hypothetical protein n=1 Tax=Ampullimonas aquatilis TaxID=1341549 RepID=UPI003C777D3B